MLRAVDKAGVHGVAIVPGPMKLLGLRTPWHGAADLAGKRIGSPPGIGEDALRALGAHPIAIGSRGDASDVDGVEEHLASYVGHRWARTMPHIDTDSIWPRPAVVFVSPEIWKELSQSEREALVEAGRSAIGPALRQIRDSEQAAIPLLCRQGAKFFRADTADLRRAAEPVYAAMRRNEQTARILEAVERMRSPGADPALVCPGSRPVAAGLPAGTYTWTLTREDALKVKGIEQSDGFLDDLPLVMRAVVERDHIVIWQSSKGGPEESGFDGEISVFEDRVKFDDGGPAPITARWSVDGDDLRFTDVTPGPDDKVVFGSKPWHRVR
jgi:hypothetical protein